ncbi:TRAP transporter substrate-binding protein [Paracoccus aerodenitrificans]|uniref:TRAP transporter substrate-binding protein n=1 Tax=Paracoccus aerodenitrificans TaxID=3017781 RepID=UPI0022F02DF2|nr:TRAP transporter substrate-binding protein [Paracoccus aerodenitrificans]WBU62465.1 TRAP transporter substrate-binding protein [Paracoccus aerodenitrificans]
MLKATLTATALTMTLASLASAQEFTMRLSHGDNESNPTHLTAVKFQELVSEYTDGRVAVQIFPSNSLGTETEVAQALRMGSIEAEILYTGNLVPLAPSAGVLMLPYAYQTTEQAHAAMDELLDPLNERLVPEAGVRALGLLEKGFRVLTTSQPVEALDDLQGLKIRVSPNDIAIKTFQSWGIEPLPMDWAEVFPALQQGVIDGQENPYTTAISSRFYEVQSDITEIHYMMWTGPLLISERVFQKYPEDIQEAVARAGRESVEYGRQVSSDLTEEAKAELVERGMTLHGAPQDEAKWADAAQALWPDFYSQVGGEEWATQAIKIINSSTE